MWIHAINRDYEKGKKSRFMKRNLRFYFALLFAKGTALVLKLIGRKGTSMPGEQGRTRGSWVSLVAAFAVVLALLLSLNVLSVSIAPSFGWYLFCGFCMALSIIAPGMSFSTLLMPLGLYTPLVDGIGNLDLGVLAPRGERTVDGIVFNAIIPRGA